MRKPPVDIRIADLGIPTRSYKQIVLFVGQWLRPEPVYADPALAKLPPEMAAYTIGDYFKAYDRWLKSREPRNARDTAELIWRDKLIGLGFTQLDWIGLPPDTVPAAALCAVGPEKLSRLSVMLLGTLTPQALARLEEFFKKRAELITIRELLNDTAAWLAPKGRLDGIMTLKRGIIGTRRKLYELGFRYQDGVFLQIGSRRELIERIMAETNIERQAAERVAAFIAANYNDVPFPD